MPTADDIPAQIARLRRWSAEARRRAARAEARAARFEEQAARLSAPLAGDLMRMAVLQRRAGARHLASARLQDQYADHLCTWLARSGGPGRRPVFMDAVAAAIGTHSATVVLFGTQRGEGVIAASDPTARAAYDLEFVLGEGPAHLAVTCERSVGVAGTDMDRRWPQYGPAVAGLGVRAVLAVPVRPPACLGAVCVYDRRPAISEEVRMAASAIADALPLMLSQAGHDRLPGDAVPALPLFGEADFPAVVHQAAGMVSQQCGCAPSDALALLRARAFTDGRTAGEIAAAVLRGELRLC
jgi:GAF domain